MGMPWPTLAPWDWGPVPPAQIPPSGFDFASYTTEGSDDDFLWGTTGNSSPGGGLAPWTIVSGSPSLILYTDLIINQGDLIVGGHPHTDSYIGGMRLRSAPTTSEMNLYLRYQDQNNWLRLRTAGQSLFQFTTTFVIEKKLNGVLTTVFGPQPWQWRNWFQQYQSFGFNNICALDRFPDGSPMGTVGWQVYDPLGNQYSFVDNDIPNGQVGLGSTFNSFDLGMSGAPFLFGISPVRTPDDPKVDNGTNPGLTDGWLPFYEYDSGFSSSLGYPSMCPDPLVFYQSGASISIYNHGIASGYWFGNLRIANPPSQPAGVAPNTIYSVTFWLKTDSVTNTPHPTTGWISQGVGGIWYALDSSPAQTVGVAVTGTVDWQLITFRLQTGASVGFGGNPGGIYFGLNGTGTIWIEWLKFTEVGPGDGSGWKFLS